MPDNYSEERIASNQMLLSFGRTGSFGGSNHEIRHTWPALREPVYAETAAASAIPICAALDTFTRHRRIWSWYMLQTKRPTLSNGASAIFR